MRGRHLRTVAALLLAACASYSPRPIESVPFKERAQTQTVGKVDVTVAVLSEPEARAVFGVELYKQGIQPVWVEVRNRDDVPHFVLPLSIDADYYAPQEVAHKSRITFAADSNAAMRRDFEQKQLQPRIGPGETVEGFVFTNLDPGAKFVHVDLYARGEIVRLTYTFLVPGLKVDFAEIGFDEIYEPGEIRDVDEAGLRKALVEMSRAVRGKPGGREGDPLNIVVVGEGRDVLSAFVRRGWDLTEAMSGGSTWKTIGAFVFGSRYRTSPISPLYVFGRKQDAGLQKARATIHERNHLRLWLAPLRFEQKPVWVGQISRDIGVRFTLKSPTIATHKIDPDVDEARTYLLQDLIYSGNLAAFGYVKGVGAAPQDRPRHNFTGDPYYTDGFRIVFFIESSRRPVSRIELLQWDRAAGK